MFWFIAFIVVVALIIEAGKPRKTQSPKRYGDNADLIARKKELQEAVEKARERQQKAEEPRKLAVTWEAERGVDASREAQNKALQVILDRARERKQKEEKARRFTAAREVDKGANPDRAAKKKELQKILDRARERRERQEEAGKPAVTRQTEKLESFFPDPETRQQKSTVRIPASVTGHSGHRDRFAHGHRAGVGFVL